jgi:glutamate 5-kinase
MSILKIIDLSKIIIIKIGTNILTTEEGKLDLNNLRDLVFQISELKTKQKKQIIIVTSGAITCGSNALNIIAKSLAEKQAAASVGQILLMQEYTKLFEQNGYLVGQILLTKKELSIPTLRTNVETTINMLLKNGIIPIINENDVVATDEIKLHRFGDNDELSGLVAELINANLLIILSDIDGLYSANPKTHKNAKLIPYLEKITEETFSQIEDTPSLRSRGGMKSKILAAEKASLAGTNVIIANGRTKNIIKQIFSAHIPGTFIRSGVKK